MMKNEKKSGYVSRFMEEERMKKRVLEGFYRIYINRIGIVKRWEMRGNDH